MKQAGAKGLVFGLSGGIDSAVVAALAKEAVGSNLIALIMPIESSSSDAEYARAVAKKLKVRVKEIDLSRNYRSLLKVLPKAGGLAGSNLKPRLRMIALYYFANKLDYLVCGTGNRTELELGYFTKYGDGGVDILPIGGLLKEQVRALARELRIPEAIIARPPSAGLWPGQTDEGEMGMSYDEIDAVLKCKGAPFPGAKAKKIRDMIKRAEHKRQGPKICKID